MRAHPRGSIPSSDPPTPRSSPRTDRPPAAPAAPRTSAPPPAAIAQLHQPSRPSCDHTPPAPPHRDTCRPDRTLPGSPSSPQQTSPRTDLHARRCRAPHSARQTTLPAGPIDATGENRWPSVGRTHVRQRGISMAASGDFLMAAVTCGDRSSGRGSRAPRRPRPATAVKYRKRRVQTGADRNDPRDQLWPAGDPTPWRNARPDYAPPARPGAPRPPRRAPIAARAPATRG